MKKRKIFIATIIIISLFSVLLTGCNQEKGTNKSENDDQVTITYWTQSTPPYPSTAEKLIEDFEAANPNIKVELESFPEYRTKVNTAFSTKNEPDVLEFYGSSINLAKGGKILPVPEEIMNKEEIENTFHENSLSNRFYDGKYYGLPNEINLESPGLVVNTNLVKKSGLKIPESWIKNNSPATWKELMDFARKLTIIEDGVMKQAGLGVVKGQEESMFLSLIWQLGGDYRDSENMKVNFDTPEGKKAVEFIISTVDGPNRVHDRGFSKRMEGVIGNTIAMTIGAPWYASVLDHDVPDMEYQYLNLPPFIKGAEPNYVAEGGWGYVVSSRTKHPKAAWTFVKFLLKKENQDYWTSAVGAFPSRKDAKAPDYDPNVGSSHKALAISADIVKYGRDPGSYTMDTSQLIWTIVRQNLRAMIQGEVAIEEGLKNMTEEANQMIERNINQ